MDNTISNIKLRSEFKVVSELCDLVVAEYAETIKSVRQITDRLQLGTSLLLLKSMFNHLTSLEFLLERRSIESSGSVATSLWGKAIMLQFLLCEPQTRIKIYTEHDTFKKLPWTIREMVVDIVRGSK